ncbi:MAG: IPT/TIG domain-containing protein, partial [Planctomycetota bacterium]|nr:IPT/TIG domain-containing protein [Planctomycetota bacterium]
AGQSNSLSFTITAVSPGNPSINSIQPNVSQVGQTVTIQGSQFDPNPSNNQVTLNGVTATVQTASANQLQVTVPNGASSGPTVVTVGGNSSNAVQLLVTSSQFVNQGSSGSQALDFLRDTSFTHLVVEIDFIQGKDANNSALNLLITRLNERCRKSNITLLIDDTIPSQNINTWRVSDLQSVEGQFRNHYSNANTTVLYFLYVNGGSEFDNGNSRVLGISYSGSALGMFRDNMDGSATPVLSNAAVEQAVIVHEAGHALGLVNNGIAMVNPHQDTPNGAHDTDNNCVMHFSIESDAISQILGTVPNQFDSQCIADMQAAGGK